MLNSQNSHLFPRIMLLTPTRPGNGSVGEIFLRELCLMVPQDNLVCFAVHSSSYEMGVESESLTWLKQKTSAMPPESMVKAKWGRMEFVGGTKARYSRIEELTEEALAFASEHNIDTIWSVLAGPTMVELTYSILARWTGRFLAHAWDPIEYVIEYFNFTPRARKAVFEKFAKVVARAERCAVASDGMKAEYELRYRTPCFTLINGSVPYPSTNSEPLARPGEFVIGFAGTAYAADTITSLINALNSRDWHVGGKNVHLKIMGNVYGLRVDTIGHAANIEFRGFRPEQEVIDYLARCDLAYLPYWMESKYELPVRLCFPNKIVQYLSASIPILYHGPQDSSPARFFTRYPLGGTCFSLDADLIVGSLEKIIELSEQGEKSRTSPDTLIAGGVASGIQESEWLKQIRQSIRKARHEYLSREYFEKQFLDFVGVTR